MRDFFQQSQGRLSLYRFQHLTLDTSYLDALPRFATQGEAALKPGLDRIAALLEALGRPHEHYPSVHIAGTHGKGSTASMVAAVLTAAGNRVGLHTSPHICHVRERMRVDGVPAPEAWPAKAVKQHQCAFDDIGASYFEATLALSLLYFAEQRVDWAVVEAGLGGRLDATNILHPELSVITRIGLDHTDILGETLEEIAGEKAGIIKPGTPLLFGVQEAEACVVLKASAQACGAPCHAAEDEVLIRDIEEEVTRNIVTVTTPRQDYAHLECGLAGVTQFENTISALRASELLGLPEEAIRKGLREVRQLSGLRGRLEVIQQRPLIVADAAHSSESIMRTMRFIMNLPPGSSRQGEIRQKLRKYEEAHEPLGYLRVLFGFMRDRDPTLIAKMFATINAGVWVAELPSERAWPSSELADLFYKHGVAILGAGPPEEGYEELKVRLKPEDVLLITGSFQLLGALPGLFCLERARE